jgi:hypothetical protein
LGNCVFFEISQSDNGQDWSIQAQLGITVAKNDRETAMQRQIPQKSASKQFATSAG